MPTLVEVRLFDEALIGRLRGKEKLAVINQLTSDAGEAIARVAEKRMSEMLAPGHKYNVGASGKASQNFRVEKVSSEYALGQVAWAVIEGEATPANAAIRTGIKPGQVPSIAALRRWAALKHIPFYDPRDADKAAQGQSHRRVRYIKTRPDDKRYSEPRPYRIGVKGDWKRTDEKIFNRALYAIQRALYKHGTERGPNPPRRGANWYPLYPSGRGRFDYVAWTVKQEGYFQREVNQSASITVQAFIDYLASGRKRAFQGKTFYVERR
jgi:hypothetical protein